MSRGMVREAPCHYQFTLPVTWGLEAKKLSREAALLAGFRARISSDIADNLSLID
jgi:hypothetical protein